MGGRRTFPAAAAAAVVAVLSVAVPASAQVAWERCADEGFGAFECGRVSVPIDRGGAVPGTVDLFARRLLAPTPSRTAVVFLSGGPGQAATVAASQVAQALAPGLRDRDLL